MPNELEIWCKALFAYTGKSYGLHATLFHTGLRYVPPIPVPPDGLDTLPRNHPDAVLFNRRIDLYARALEQAETYDQRIFGLIWDNLSEDSINRASRSLPIEDWLQIVTSMNAQALLVRVRASHQGAGASIPALN